MKTVKVRIALEIDTEGNWQACGNDLTPDWNEVMGMFDGLTDSKCYWIEAEVPVPECAIDPIAGKAVEVEPA